MLDAIEPMPDYVTRMSPLWLGVPNVAMLERTFRAWDYPAFAHWHEGRWVISGLAHPQFTVASRSPWTITPAISCQCGLLGRIEDGKWVAA